MVQVSIRYTVYMLHKYDLFITAVCSVILIYLNCALNVFVKFHLSIFFFNIIYDFIGTKS